MFKCEECGELTNNSENDYAEHICDDCNQNLAEAGWERFCSNFYGGSDPVTLREQQIAARRLK